MKRMLPYLMLTTCLMVAACAAPSQPMQTPMQSEIARVQARNLIEGMKGLTALQNGDTTGAAIFIESLVYNATADILASEEYRYDQRLVVWINDVAEYRKEHPRPIHARTPIDDQLDKLLADYQGKNPRGAPLDQ